MAGEDSQDKTNPTVGGGLLPVLYLLMGTGFIPPLRLSQGPVLHQHGDVKCKVGVASHTEDMAVSRMRFVFTPSANTHFTYIDLAKCLSIQERKLHRQFRTYTVLGGLLQDSNNDTTVRFNTAPNTWVTRTALRRGFKLWSKMNRQAMEGAPGMVRPKYHDWKVYLNAHHQGGAGNLVPADAAGDTIDAGEWEYSKYVSEDPDLGAFVSSGAADPTQADIDADQFYAHIVGEHVTGPGYGAAGGDNWTSVGLIRSWVDSRPEPQASQPLINSQAELARDPLVNLFDEADVVDEVLENLEAHNDAAPYDHDEPFGFRLGLVGNANNLQRQSMASTSAANPIVPFSGFQAINGLVQVHTTQPGALGELTLLLDVDTQGVKV